MSIRKLSMSAADVLMTEKIMHKKKKRGFRNSKHFQPLMVAFLCFGFATFLSVYILYHMKVFLDVYHISTEWIRIVQALFLVWNAVNDPLMGYFQDFGLCGMKWIKDRRKVIMYSAPVFAFSYMIFWFPWSTTNTVVTGLHLLFGLFLFDTLLTLVLSAYCGILVETCEEHSQRVRCLVYADLFRILGMSSIFPLNVYSNEAKDFTRFQIGAAVIALISASVMSTGAYFINSKQEEEAQEEIELKKKNDSGREEQDSLNNDIGWKVNSNDRDEKKEENEIEKESTSEKKEDSFKNALGVSWQICRQPRFLCLVGSGFMRTLRTTATGAFLIILVQALVSQPGFMESGSPALSLYYAMMRPLSCLVFMFLWKPLAVLGTHKTMLIMEAIACINVIVAFIIGRGSAVAVLIFIGVEQVSALTGEYSFFMLLTGEVIDTDTSANKRTSPLSTMIFTLKALFTKPAEQLSPLIFITLLERGGFTAYRGECIKVTGIAKSNSTILPTTELPLTTEFPIATEFTPIVEQPQCTTLLGTMHSSILYFTLFCTLAEILFVAADYWYKRRVLHEEDKKTNPLEIAMNEEDFVKNQESIKKNHDV